MSLFFFISGIILAMAWWLGRPTSLQMSSWTRFGSLTSICPPIVLERCSQRLSLTLESSHESKSCSFLSTCKFTDTCVSSLSFWGRGLPDCGPGANARFIETLELFFESVNLQAKAREQNDVPDLESYIDLRRDTSGEYNSKHRSINPKTNVNWPRV